MNERYPERSNFQIFDITISKLSEELKRMIRTYELETGDRIPIENGTITISIKDRINSEFNQDYQRDSDLDYFK
mgnify:FL=1